MMGLDFLGLANKHWKVADSISVFPEGWALGVFAREFGDAMPNVRKFLESGKVGALRVHAHWDKDHNIKPTIAPMDFLEKELPRWEALHQEFPNIPKFMSHTCEYSHKSQSAVAKRVAIVQKLCPSWTVVQTPMKAPVVKGVGLLEQHGTNSKPKPGHIVSTDGQHAFDIDIEEWLTDHKDAQLNFLWAPRFNLRENVKPPKTLPPPKLRTAYPTKADIKSVTRLAYGQAADIAPTFPVTPLKKPLLWKTHAEDPPGDADKRANRPLIILPHRTDFVEIVTRTGAVIGKFNYDANVGPFPGGLFRFYSGNKGSMGLYGYQIGVKALDASGYERIWVKQRVGNDVFFYGPICPPFRTPFFQEPK